MGMCASRIVVSRLLAVAVFPVAAFAAFWRPPIGVDVIKLRVVATGPDTDGSYGSPSQNFGVVRKQHRVDGHDVYMPNNRVSWSTLEPVSQVTPLMFCIA